MAKETIHTTIEFAHLAEDVAEDKLASEITRLDLRGVMRAFTDYFVIITANSNTHLRALKQDIETALIGFGATLYQREGTPESGWILLDFGDLIIHIFGTKEREFYKLESVWSDAVETVRIQ